VSELEHAKKYRYYRGKLQFRGVGVYKRLSIHVRTVFTWKAGKWMVRQLAQRWLMIRLRAGLPLATANIAPEKCALLSGWRNSLPITTQPHHSGNY
jgi:hypothetical protein